jgi:hypothetical protein
VERVIRLDALIQYKTHNERKIILTKGYQHVFGRALYVVKAMERIYLNYPDFEIVHWCASRNYIVYIVQKKLPF